MSTSEIVRTLTLTVPPEAVWDYLTKPEKLAEWFHAPKTDLVAGKSYELFGTESGDKLCWGEVVTHKPFTELSYTFSIKPFAGVMTTVAWTLEPVGTGTKLTLRHTGFDQLGDSSTDLHGALSSGWDGHLERLAANRS